MALILKDRVKETSSSSGTGNITLSGAFAGYQTFNAAIASGSTVYYTIHNLTSGSDDQYEVGVGTFTSPSTLSRDTVFTSSAGAPTKVNFTAGAGGLEVFITQPAEEAVYINQATGKVEAFGNGANTITFTNVNTTNLVANTVTLTAGTITTNAANATDITNKTYVDGLFSTGITYHAPVRVESPNTAGNLNATYNQPGGAGVGVGATLTNAGTQAALVIDGITMVVADRVLIYNQTNAVQNGIYTVTNVGSVSTNWVLTRATDADTYGVGDPNKLGQGDAFFVTSGNTGAGETYICNTVGTITFGTTNITFAQISSVQVYSAGTGLNLTNLTFNVSNTAVTAAQYGNDGAVGQFTVNAQGQLTNAANVSINASSITLGTLDNARTTAASANGASTIVARDANGNFTANVITATTSNATTFNGTTGAFTNVSGNGVALTAINASNISSGTIANARTTASDANSASTIVARDSNGSFGANIITATFSGNGATLSAINASNISSGTIANARTTAASANGASTIVQRDSGGNFAAATVTAAVIGDLSGGSNINASNIASGTIVNARTTANTANGASTIVLRGSSGEFAAGAITGTSFSGNGSALTAINATAITTGTLDNARTSAASANGASTIVARDAGGNFSANTITATTFSGAMSGNGAALTNINASNITSGTLVVAQGGTGTGTAFTTGSVVFAGSSGVYTQNNANLFWDNTNARLGIGSTTPRYKLDIFDESNATFGFTEYNNSDGPTIRLFRAGGTIASPTVAVAGYSLGGLRCFGYTGAAFGSLSAAIDLVANQTFAVGSQGSYIQFRTTADSTASSTEKMRIFGSGGVSIGNTTDPGATNLSVTGTIAGNGTSLTAINASNISSGTIANARTTAATANGASTIVLRDSSGNAAFNGVTAQAITAGGGSAQARRSVFTANSENFATYLQYNAATNGVYIGATSTANTFVVSNAGGSAMLTVDGSGNGTFNGTITGNGATITAINASNISSGTIANARTTGATANGASTLVLRDANGDFSARTITANLTGTASSATTATNQSGGTVSATTGSFSGLLTGASSASTDVNTANDTGSFSARGNASTIASMSFHRTGAYAINMGLGTDNVFRIGGWSASNNCFQLTGAGAGTFLSTCTATQFTANSDERLKENWTDVAPDFISKLAQVKHGVFSRTDSGNREPGVGAQSFMTVLPEAVVEGADGYLSVNYGGAALVAAIELAKVVEELRAEIAELKAK